MIELLQGIHETVNFESMRGVKVYQNNVAEDFPLHWHNAIEIIMPMEGGYTVALSGQRVTLSPADIFVLPPGELHTLYAPKTGSRLIIQIDYSLLCNLVGMDSLLQLLRPYKLVTQDEKAALSGELRQLLYTIYEEYAAARPFKESCIYAQIVAFFVALGRSCVNLQALFPKLDGHKQAEYCEKFMWICGYINEHCTGVLTVEKVAREAGFSKFHFCRLFKQFTGSSFYDYLQSRRISYVETLLVDPACTVTEAALQAGFSSISTFNRTFKQHKQCTPSQYRALHGVFGVVGEIV